MKKLLYALIILLGAVLLLFCFLPAYERDELLYHLAVPRYWLWHDLSSPLFSHYFFYPWLPFLINMAAVETGAVSLAHVLHLSFFFMTAVIIYREIPNSIVGLWIVLLYMTLQPSLRFGYTAYSDFYSLFFGASAFFLLYRWAVYGDVLYFLLSAVMAGMALLCKYNMLIFVFLLVPLCMVFACGRYSVAKAFGITALYSIILGTLYVPFMVKNFILTNSPLYPFFSEITGSDNAFAFTQVSHFEYRKVFFEETFFDIIVAPIRAFIHGKENSIEWFDGNLNPFFLLLPLCSVFLYRDRQGTIFLVFAWLYITFVLFLEQLSVRFMLPAIPILAVVAGRGIAASKIKSRWLALLFLPFLIYNITMSGHHLVDRDKYSYLLGRISKDEFLSRKLPDYDGIMYINSIKPIGKVLLLFTGQRTYYLESDFVYDSYFDGRLFMKLCGAASDAESIRKNFADMGITHMYLRSDFFDKFLNENIDAERPAIMAFMASCKLVYTNKEYRVLQL